ncbi:MAG: rhomboid family intramembrane serine protease, partial [Myxococcota bacterium]
ILTAGLYHFGWLHLTLNVLGIALLGRQVEARLGHLWTFATFWVSSIGAMSILAATVPAGTPPGIVVGASGGLMGILGAVIGGVAVRYAKERRRPDRRQLVVLLFIVAFQVIFDAATPQVSGAVHLYGLAIGTGVGVFATVARSRSQSVKASA